VGAGCYVDADFCAGTEFEKANREMVAAAPFIQKHGSQAQFNNFSP
jgi:hypothetical protein